jgi:hypothetical protein
MRKFKPSQEDKQDRKASIYILIASSILTILIMLVVYLNYITIFTKPKGIL